jgi:hypothetical protein
MRSRAPNQPFLPDVFDDVITGCADQIADEMNVVREVTECRRGG